MLYHTILHEALPVHAGHHVPGARSLRAALQRDRPPSPRRGAEAVQTNAHIISHNTYDMNNIHAIDIHNTLQHT